MAVEVILPKWGLTMETGILAKWHKHEGDSVTQGEIIADVETEKIVSELEAPVNGVITKIIIAEGTEDIEVGTVLCIINEG
jgi:pyruvate/2-oxoglutarate dehydrogenase complex dihydrolipoamide acyltransferase (E2) component